MTKFYALLLLLLVTACSKNESKNPSPDAVINLEAKSGVVTGAADFGVFNSQSIAKMVTFQITNNGTEPLVGPASLDNPSFNLTYQNCPASLAVKASCSVKVSFDPKNKTIGNHSANLMLDSVFVSLSATMEQLVVTQNVQFLLSSAEISSLDFGSLTTKQNVLKTISIKNLSNAPVTEAIVLSPNFSTSYDSCSGKVISKGETCTVKVTLSGAGKLGAITGTLDYAGKTLNLQGTVTAPATGGTITFLQNSVVMPDQSNYDFGSFSENANKQLVLTIKNTGTLATPVSTAALSDATNFSISYNTCSNISLAASASCQVRVLFSSAGKSANSYATSLTFSGKSLALSATVAGSTYIATFAYPANTLVAGEGSRVVSATGIATCRVQPANTLVANSNCSDQLASAPDLTQKSPVGDKIITVTGGQANIPMLEGENWSIKPVGSQQELITQYLICQATHIKDGATCQIFDITNYSLSKSSPRMGEWITVDLQGYLPLETAVTFGSSTNLEAKGSRKRFNVRLKPAAVSLTDSIMANGSFSSFLDSIMVNITGIIGYPEVKITSFSPSPTGATYYNISGQVTNLGYLAGPPTDYTISVCVNTSEFYCQTKGTLAANGSFSIEDYNSYDGQNNRDRLHVVLTTTTWANANINGEVGVTGHADNFVETNNKYIVPYIPNGNSIIAYANLYTPLAVAATGVDPQIDNIITHLEKPLRTANGPNPGPAMSPSPRLVRSFLDIDNFALYDQALAIFALTKASMDNPGQKIVLQNHAKSIMNALLNLEAAHGSNGYWFFSYSEVNDNGPYPAAGDRRMAGAIGWTLMAMSYYKTQYPADTAYDALLARVRSYLLNQMVPITINGVASRALRFNPTDLASTPFNEANQISLEHNLDLYGALRLYKTAYPAHADMAVTNQRISELRTFNESLWNNDTKRFYAGADISGAFNANEYYLDTQSWGIMALGTKSQDTLTSYIPGLETNCRLFFETAGFLQNSNIAGVAGFFDLIPASLVAPHKFIWTEGTIGQILAMNSVAASDGVNLTCHGFSKEDLAGEMQKLKNAQGGVPYATSSLNADFSTSESISGTAWLYFLNHSFNPFNP